MNLTRPQSAAGRSFLSPGVTVVVDEELDLDAVVVINAATGRRVTEADVQAEARELDRMRGLIPGGKSLSGDGSHSPALRVVVGAETALAVRERAAAEHMSVSKYLRRLIERDVAS